VQEVDSFLNAPTQRQRLKPFTLKEIQDEINTLKPKKAPGHDNITAIILKQLPWKGQIKLLYIFNAILRLNYWPRPLKIIIMILKPGKNPADVTSYRPISLLPTISKVLEKLILNKINQEAMPIYIPSASPLSSSLSPEAGTIGQEWPQCQ
jgi:hypothetical protein